MGVQSGANLTGATMSSQSCELETSSITDHDTMTTPPPVGGGSKAGAQESPSLSNVEIEYNVIPPDKGKGKAVLDNNAHIESDQHSRPQITIPLRGTGR